jgi:hypothetical protein
MALLADCFSDRMVIAALTRFDLAATRDTVLIEHDEELAASSLFAMPNRVSRVRGSGSASVLWGGVSLGILFSRPSA